MFCPRCGRPVNAEANFCGGCGLSRIEIEKYLSKTAPQQPVQEAPQQEVPQQTVQDVPQQETVLNSTVFSEPAEEKIPQPQQAVQQEPQQSSSTETNHVFWQSEPAKAEEPAAEKATENTADNATTSAYTDNNCTYAYSYKKAESTDCAAHSSNTQSSTAQSTANTADAVFTAAAEEVKKEAPLTTVDFIWMLVLSSLPVIGLIYLIYLAVQNNNINKRSFARATLIVAVFAFVITFVFMIGVAIAGLF